MIDLKEITDTINRETASVPTFTLEWLESRLKPIHGAVIGTLIYLIDKGQIIYSHTKRILRKGEVVDELFYKTNNNQDETKKN